MGTHDDKTVEVDNAARAVGWVQKFRMGSLMRDATSPFHFDDLYDDIQRLVDMYGHITESILRGLSVRQVVKVRECADRDFALLEAARKFVPDEQDNAQAAHAKIVADIREACADSIDLLMLYAHHGVQKLQSLQVLQSKLQQRLNEADSAAKPLEEQVKEAQEKIKNKTAQLWEAVSAAEVSAQSGYFESEGQKHVTASYVWMVLVFAAMALLVGYALRGDELFPVDFPEEGGIALTYAIAQAAITRVLVVTVLGYALFFCARNYAAHRHNAIVNRHRKNALSTYIALVEANSTPENRDIVLAQAARCIFAPQESGYVRRGNSGDGEISVMRHVARGVAQGGE